MTSRRILTLLAAVVAALALAACGGGGGDGGGELSIGPPEGVAIEIGTEKVLNGEIDRRAQFLATTPTSAAPVEPPARDSAEFREFRLQAAETLRDERIYGILAKQCGKPCTVTDADVQKLFDQIKEEQFDGSQAEFDEALQARGITPEDLRASLRASEQLQALLTRVRDKAVYTDAEGLAYYRKNIANYKLVAEKRLSHILVETKAQAEAIRAEATPENFAELARERSIDAAAKNPGGEDLGSIASGSLLPELQEAAAKLKGGQISAPVQSQFGWHVLLLRDIKARTRPYDEVKDEIRLQELQIKQAAAEQTWRDTVLKKQQDRAKYVNDKIAPEPTATATSSTPAGTTSTPTTSTSTAPATTPTGTTSGPATP